MKNAAKETGRQRLLLAVIFLLFAAIIAAAAGFLALLDYNSKNVYMGYYDYYDSIGQSKTINPETITVVSGGAVLAADRNPAVINGVLYFPSSFIESYLDPYIFYQEEAGRLTVTTTDKVYKFTAGSPEYTVNMYTSGTLSAPVLDEKVAAWLSADDVCTIYGVGIDYMPPVTDGDPNILILTDPYETSVTATITEGGAKLRYAAEPKSPIYADLSAGETVLVFGEPVASESGKFMYYKAMTNNGVVGHILTGEASELTAIPGLTNETDDYKPNVPQNGGIVMAWQYFNNTSQSADPANMKNEKGLDVVAPTWFSLNPETADGGLVSIANIEYTRWAHGEGLLVWGMVTDSSNKDLSNAVLSICGNRERLIGEIINHAEQYELDGINIDFEAVNAGDARYFQQFLRELYPLCRERGLTLSVDMYAPSAWNMYYNRTEAAKTCDYIIIMGYDEYWSTRQESGPNASIGFVRNAVLDTLNEVPASKVILGVPFFVRVWSEELGPLGDVTFSSKSYSMDRAFRMFAENNVTFIWDEVTEYYYGEYETLENGRVVVNKVWLEDERSMESKLLVIEENGLAGISAWRKGLEKESIWDLIYRYIKQ